MTSEKAIEIIREFMSDVEAVGVKETGRSWPDLLITYNKARIAMAPACPVCKDKRYLISMRDEGRKAVEACDACRDAQTFTDEDAAALAQADGIRCDSVYPCYLMS